MKYCNATHHMWEEIGSFCSFADDIWSDCGDLTPSGWVVWHCNKFLSSCMVCMSMPWSGISAYMPTCVLYS